MEELNCETVFTIPVFGGIPIAESVVVSWIIMAALTILSICLVRNLKVENPGKKKGLKGWVKSFAEPVAIIAPINILEIFIKPLSLCMRLFGNVLGSFVVMELIKQLVAPIIPIPFSMYFDIFDGLIQAYVFVFLTALFIKEAVE